LFYGTSQGFALAIQEDRTLEMSLTMYGDASLGRMHIDVSFWIAQYDRTSVRTLGPLSAFG